MKTITNRESLMQLGEAMPSMVMASNSLMNAYAGTHASVNDQQRMAGAMYSLEQAERYIASAKGKLGACMNREGVR